MFWDTIKPKVVEPRPVEVKLSSSGDLHVTWDDGKASAVAPRRLRGECPCAACVEEWTGRKLVIVDQLPKDVRPLALEPVGNYALKVRWSDGHESGIYTWKQLRTYLLELPAPT